MDYWIKCNFTLFSCFHFFVKLCYPSINQRKEQVKSCFTIKMNHFQPPTTTTTLFFDDILSASSSFKWLLLIWNNENFFWWKIFCETIRSHFVRFCQRVKRIHRIRKRTGGFGCRNSREPRSRGRSEWSTHQRFRVRCHKRFFLLICWRAGF